MKSGLVAGTAREAVAGRLPADLGLADRGLAAGAALGGVGLGRSRLGRRETGQDLLGLLLHRVLVVSGEELDEIRRQTGPRRDLEAGQPQLGLGGALLSGLGRALGLRVGLTLGLSVRVGLAGDVVGHDEWLP